MIWHDSWRRDGYSAAADAMGTGCMPEEYRRLVFSDMEVIAAVKEQSLRSKDPIPTGKLKFLTIDGGSNPYVHFAVDLPEGDKAFRIEGAVLAAALIRYCIDNSIPIPQKAQKLLSSKDHQIVMDIKR
jgi:hypothetical protein